MTTDLAYFESRDGLQLFYRDYAGADPAAMSVLCLPGLSRNSRDFVSTAQRISQGANQGAKQGNSPGRRVLTPDLRGRGFSAWDPDWHNYHPGTYVEDCWRLLELTQIPRVIVIGTSLGGLMAMIMAAMRPDAIAAVVLNDVGPELAPEGIERIKQYVGKLPSVTSWEEAAQQAKLVYGEALPDVVDWLQYSRLSYRENEVGRPVLDMDPDIGTAARHLEATAPKLWPVFGKLAGRPVMVLRGENSDILSQQTLDKMIEMLPQLQTVIVPNCGHAPTLDEPASVNAIDKFLGAKKRLRNPEP